MTPLIRVHDAAGLLAALRELPPGLSGDVSMATTGAITADAAGEAAVLALHDDWRRAHPEAGPLYWASRSWTMAIWQPVYLAVLSLHLSDRLPALHGIAQWRREGGVCGFSLPNGRLLRGDEADLMAAAGQSLQTLCATMFDLLAREATLHPKLAGRLTADCAVSALLAVQRCDPRFDNGRLSALVVRWLSALGLPDASGVMTVRLDDGRERLALKRKACCQHFRRGDGGVCSSCPKLKPAARLALLKQELSHDVLTA